MNTKIEELREKIENCKSEKFLPCYVKYDLVESLIQAYEKEISFLNQQLKEATDLIASWHDECRKLEQQLSNSVSKEEVIKMLDSIVDSENVFPQIEKIMQKLSKSKVKK